MSLKNRTLFQFSFSNIILLLRLIDIYTAIVHCKPIG